MQQSHGTIEVFTRRPHPALRLFVKNLRIVEFREACRDAHLPDTGLVAALRLRGECDFEYAGAAPNAALTGLFDRVRRHAHSRGNLMALVAFTPLGASAFTRMPLDELANTTASLTDVFEQPAEIPTLVQQLGDAPTHARRLELLERHLLARINHPPLDPLIAAAIDWIERSAPAARMDALVRHIGLSQSALERRFRRTVGVSPKRFASLVRLQRVVRLCREGLPLTARPGTSIRPISFTTSNASLASRPRRTSLRRTESDPVPGSACVGLGETAPASTPARSARRILTIRRQPVRVSCARAHDLDPPLPAAVDVGSLHHPPTSMNTFVIIFRQPRPLTQDEQDRIRHAMPAWARTQNAAGRNLEPRILGPDRLRVRDTAPTIEPPVTALLFIEANDLTEAAAVAATHPGAPFGVDIEVRPWSAPVPTS